ncbi:DNA-binding protein [Auraticoccus sp. F435]|uniref:DNA-binding protein n=1 Tax=Auraticoccus cholistanensis TaxID=2656650 RepID=A0A6A9USR6_9ACTN|nr:OB-fold nucleic acid binding domain-containing protein [Auraticoccus cholistanensis]MVA75731.1 DNA-binding protein [Auraticoccus cholistanensis]
MDQQVGERSRRGAFSRALARLVSSNEELESEQLQREVRQCGATPLAECADRSRVTASGTVTCITMQPRGTTRWLQVDLKDGSGTLTLVWMGRRSIPGIEPGVRLKVEGRITTVEGQRVMFNPRYELLSVAR